jgi:hypothetical protein
MSVFPPIPPHGENQPWSPNVFNAHRVVSDIFKHAEALRRGDPDPNRIQFHIGTLTNDAIPLLYALEAHAEEEGLDVNWILSCAEAVGGLVGELQKAEQSLRGR